METAKPLGYYGNLTDVHEKAVKEVKNAFKDLPERYNTIMLLRFLRARKFDVHKTIEMIRNDIEWRKEMNVDTVLETFPKNKWFNSCVSYWPADFHGTDQFGVPVYWERLGLVDPKSIVGTIPEADLIQFHIWAMERIEKILKDASDKISNPDHLDRGLLYVEDFTGLGMKHMNSTGLAMVKMLSQIDQDHYPELLRKAIAVRVPSFFSVIWKVISPWLDPITQGKVELCGDVFVEQLNNERVDIASVPAEFGGKCKCNKHEKGCLPVAGIFGDLPESSPRVVINSGGKHDHVINVKEQCVLELRFKLTDHNIGFAVYYEDSKGNRKEVVPYNRYESQTVQHQITAETSGSYVLHWDNSYSMWRKKTVQYQVVVHDANSEQ